jgi:o-succinylbenzoate---CoA ligase
VVLATSGSTGAPRGVALPAAALLASAQAAHERLGGPGAWLLALPVTSAGGLNVVVRALVARTEPLVLDSIGGAGGFDPAAFAALTWRLDPSLPAYTSLVPAQAARLLADDESLAALRGYQAVLVGGSRTPLPLLEDLIAAHVAAVTTYGMTETCGGCVYDGVALDGVQVDVDAEQRVSLTGPVLATGYLGRPDLDATTFVTQRGARWLRTADRGRVVDGRLQVLGRLDDVLVSGGVKVDPQAVEAVVAAHPHVREVCVVGVPDQHWGQCVVAVVVTSDGAAPALQDLRTSVAAALGPASAPRQVVVVDALPLRGPGKPDRRAAARLAVERQAQAPPA